MHGLQGAGGAEGKKKPTKAKLGDKNTMFYDNEARPAHTLTQSA